MNKEVSGSFQALSMGESGTMVYITQKILNTIGYKLKEDGVFSLHMEKTVKTFQSTISSLVVDGVVGYETMKEMDEARTIV
ncbi:MAG TPA: peptidoglycan-binding protein [Campylobacterales bacterium]|nr:peptidoglycan-binding protein [Campylobacterales bacterium]